MFRIRRDSKYIVIIVVIALSVYLGLRKSNLKNIFIQQRVSVDTSVAQKIFESSSNIRKLKMTYNVEELVDINSFLAEILEYKDTSAKYSDSKGSYHLLVFEFHNTNFNEIMMKLRQVNGLDSENIQSASTTLFSANIEENLKNNQLAKKRVQELMNKSTSDEKIARLSLQLEKIQTKIDSLKNQNEIRKHNSEYDLVMLTAVKQVSDGGLKKSLRVFVVTTFVVLIALIIGLIIFYYITVLLIKLMAAMGIKTARASASGYGYSYRRRPYGRQVKKIYKDEDGKTIKEE
jgi:hypothetical protein